MGFLGLCVHVCGKGGWGGKWNLMLALPIFFTDRLCQGMGFFVMDSLIA